MSEWKPIETAPRNGADILVYVPDSDPADPSVVMAHLDERRGETVWRIYLDGCSVEPTHWMPLPEPPINVGATGSSEPLNPETTVTEDAQSGGRREHP